MQTIKASEFKAKCLLHLMDEINQTGEEIVTSNRLFASPSVKYPV